MSKILLFCILLLTGSLPALAQHVPSIMNLSAHPDDEDGSTLAYYRYKYGIRTYSVFFTRGEGGQNEIGPQLYADLGVLRTAETERAARIVGSEVYFLNFVDFGFSKTANETFDMWGYDAPVERLVYLIRKLKPEILFTNHDTATGHGNHQAVARAALRAFSLAADSTFHPEQLTESGVELYQPKKLYVRVFPQRDSLLKPDVVHPVGTDTLALGKTAARLAMEALSQHRTQGMDKTVASGRFARFVDSTRYILIRSNGHYANLRNDFLGGLHLPGESRLPLIPTRSALKVTLSDSVVVRNQKFFLEIVPLQQLLGLTVTLDLPSGWSSGKVEDGGSAKYEVVVGGNAAFTYPKVRHLYETMRSFPPITVNASYILKGAPEKETIPVYFDTAPLQTISLASTVFRITDEPLKIPFTVTNYFTKQAAGRVIARVSDDWDAVNSEFIINKEDSVWKDSVSIIPPRSLPEGGYAVSVCIDGDTAGATVKRFRVLTLPGLNVGVVQSYDDVFDGALNGLRVRHRLLTEKDLSSGDLRPFGAIIVDNRAYLARPDLVENNERMLDYVRQGGTLIVMYQRPQEWKPEHAPYPFSISGSRITDEKAPVAVLKPGHRLFNFPNKIDSTAWQNWMQERALYMPTNVPSQYERLISSSDAGEPPLDTGLLVARYGTGNYVYTSYVWYRELKEVNTGAFKIFANMICLGQGEN